MAGRLGRRVRVRRDAWVWVALVIVVVLIWTAFPVGVLAAAALLFARAWLLRHHRPLWRPLWPLVVGVGMLLYWADRYLR